MSYAVTKSRVLQYIGIILILAVFAGAYWYFKVYGSTLNQSQNDLNTNGLVGMWSFNGDDISGTTAYDRSGSGNNGTLTNGPTATQGKVGQALDFDGTNDYVSTADYSYSNAQAFTMSVWFKADTVSGNQVIFSKTTYEYNLRLTDATLAFAYWDTGGVGAIDLSYSNVAANRWYLVDVTYDGSGAAYMYVDGVRVASDTNIVNTFQNKAEALLIGGGYHISGNPGYLNGQIDEMRIYNRAITASEVTALYTQGGGTKSNTSISQPQGTGRLDSGLAGYWKLDDGSGTSATDSSTNGNTGTMTNMESGDWTTGQIGSAGVFDGVDERVSVPDSNALDITQTITVSAWVKGLTNWTGTTEANFILCKCGYSTFEERNYQLYVSTAGKLRFGFDRNGVGGGVSSNATLSIGQWYFVTATYDQKNISLYINGTLDTVAAETDAMVANTYTLAIGSARENTGNYGHWEGNIDETRIYNRALSADEVAQLYRLNSPTSVDTSLKGYWSFNAPDMASTTAYDRSGAGNTGTLTNGPAIAEGKIGQALNFDGTDDYVQIADSNTLDATTALTVSVWFKKTRNGTFERLINKQNNLGGGSTSEVWLLQTTNTNGIQMAVGPAGSQNNYYVYSTGTITDTNWHFITGTYTAADSKVRLYIDGVLDTTATPGTTGNDSGTLWSGNLEASTGVLNIGRLDFYGVTYYSQGVMDEPRIYNRALTAAEIKGLYDTGESDKVNSSVSQPQGTGRLDSGLAGYWPLDDGSGTSATDVSTNGNTGTLSNSPTWTTGQIGGALDFDGVDDVVNAGSNSSLDDIARKTVSVWIKPDSLGENSLGYIVRKIGGGLSNGWVLLLCNSSVTDCPSTANTITLLQTGNGRWHMPANSISFSGSWIHVVFTYDSSSTANDPIFYLNGVRVTTTEASTPSSITSDAASDLLIGNGANGDRTFDGSIDELRIYNRILSESEVSQLYRLTSPTGTETSLKGYWSFNGKDVSSTTAFDSSGGGNNGTLTNGPAITEGKIGQGLSFDGVNDYVDLGTGSSIRYTTTGSIAVWVKTSCTGTCVIIGGNADTEIGYNLFLESGTLKYRQNKFNEMSTPWTGVYNDGNWHFVVVSKSGANGTLYVDNVSKATSTGLTGSWGAHAIYLGNEYNRAYYFSGSMDEVRVYDRALTTAEITALYNASR